MLKFFARRHWWGAAILCVVTVAGCGPAPLGTSWAAVSLIDTTCNTQTKQNIVVAYSDRITMVNPIDGKPAPILDQNCQVVQDDQGKAKVWDFRGGDGGAKQFFTSPLIADKDALLAISYDEHIFQVNLPLGNAYGNKAGTPISGVAGHTVADIASNDDTLFVGLSAKNLVALDRKAFNVKWEFPTEHGVWAKPLVVGDNLYFSSLDHNLYAVDVKTGAQKWVLDLSGAVTSTPTMGSNGNLYIGSFARKIFEISPEGKIINTYETADWVWGTPIIVDNILYAADLAGNVYALDTAKNLGEVWKQKVASMAIRATPLITGDTVIVASRDQKIYWLNRKDGTAIIGNDDKPLVRELKSPIFSDILLIQPSETLKIDEPYIVVSTTSTSEMLVAYTLNKGQLVWTYAFQ